MPPKTSGSSVRGSRPATTGANKSNTSKSGSSSANKRAAAENSSSSVSRASKRQATIPDDEDEEMELDDRHNTREEEEEEVQEEGVEEDQQEEEEEEEEEDERASVPSELVTRILHEFFEKEGTRITKGANKAVVGYVDVFVREAIARSGAVRGSRGGFLEVEDLEKVAPELLLDM